MSNWKDETGNVYVKLTVKALTEKRGKNRSLLWECDCACGGKFFVSGTQLREGNIESCGCLKKPIDETGNVYGRLNVLRRSHVKHGHIYLECECRCGKRVVVQKQLLISGITQSCGCLRIERITTHGLSESAEYKTWVSMVQRCTNPNLLEYHQWYGGKGIKVYKDWLGRGGFKRFYDHVGLKPSHQHSLDRYPNHRGNYEPGNVRWATKAQQSENKKQVSVALENLTLEAIIREAKRRGLELVPTERLGISENG